MSDRPMKPGARYALKHTTRWVRAVVEDLRYAIDVSTLHRHEDAASLGMNDIGRVRLSLGGPLMVDAYNRNRTTGSFILVDEASNETAGAGMILEPHR